MNRRRAIIGLSLLCALALTAFSAPNAVAAKGTTVFTCKQGAGLLDFSDEHCTNGVTQLTGKWGHQEIAANKATAFTATNEKTGPETKTSTEVTLQATIGGVTVHITCVGAHVEGSLTNEAGPPMKVKLTGVKKTLTGCSMGEPKFECAIAKKEIKFNELSGTTPTETMSVELTPVVGTTLATIVVEKCKIEGSYKLTGTLGAIPEGATYDFNETSSKLELAGKSATLNARLTPRMKEEPFQESNPLAYTTTAT